MHITTRQLRRLISEAMSGSTEGILRYDGSESITLEVAGSVYDAIVPEFDDDAGALAMHWEDILANLRACSSVVLYLTHPDPVAHGYRTRVNLQVPEDVTGVRMPIDRVLAVVSEIFDIINSAYDSEVIGRYNAGEIRELVDSLFT